MVNFTAEIFAALPVCELPHRFAALPVCELPQCFMHRSCKMAEKEVSMLSSKVFYG